MEHELFNKLDAVLSRFRRRNLWQSVAWGLLTGSTIACGLGAGKWLLPGLLFPVLAAVSIGAGLGAGLWRARRVLIGRREAAMAIDRHAGLDDRTLSALGFLESNRLRPIHELQIAETTKRIEQVEPIEVLPSRLPLMLVLAMLVTVVAVGLIVWPVDRNGSMATTGESPKPRPQPPVVEKSLESVREEIGWRAAPVGRIVTHRTNLLSNATLKQVVDKPDGGELIETSGVVLEDERLPLEHRTSIRRYFESSE